MTFPVVGSNIPSVYQISNSLRFNDGDSPKLEFTPSSTGNNQTFTFSFWFKRGNLGGTQSLFYTDNNGSGSTDFLIFLSTSDQFSVGFLDAPQYYLRPSMVLRDTSAWYHAVVSVDTTQATASNRLKVYINGIEPTDFAIDNRSSLPQNTNLDVNKQAVHRISGYGSTSYFDGYIAEYYFIDGQALSPTDFGEFDEDSGVWKPKQYAGTYGTNGFYLKFNNTGNMGEDSSGNDNTWTPTNLSGTTDVTTDTPTNNFNTLNPLSYLTAGGGVAWSEGNCRVEMTSTATDLMCNGTFAVSSGKWYFEWKVTDLNVYGGIHDADAPLTSNNYNNSSLVYMRGGTSLQAPVDVTGLTSIATNDIVSMFVDLDNFTVKTAVNGVDDGYTKSIEQKTYTFGNCTNGSSASSAGAQFNFGNPSFTISSGNSDANGYGNFEYSPNDGTYDYLALCTQNLATELSPTIDDGSQYFNTVLYSGDDVDGRTVTGVGFNPDWTWIKRRSASADHMVADTSRGTNANLHTNATNAEFNPITDKQGGGIGSLTTDGFILEQGISSMNNVNDTGSTYVAWNWKANAGSTSSNTDGSITSTVQANTTAGFSIVTYTGTTGGLTVGHGLGTTPKVVLYKRRDSADNWIYWTTQIDGSYDYLVLNSTSAKTDSAAQTFTSSTFIDTGGVAGTFVAYCFAEIEGYSKFGSYTGNGSSDGTFIYTGFRPAFVIVKRSDGSGFSWGIYDNKRPEYNLVDRYLMADQSIAEQSGNNQLDLLSNGIKMKSSNGGTNTSGAAYIYMAFAENPFVTSGATPVTAR